MKPERSYKLYLKEELARLEKKLHDPNSNKQFVSSEIRRIEYRVKQRLKHSQFIDRIYDIPYDK